MAICPVCKKNKILNFGGGTCSTVCSKAFKPVVVPNRAPVVVPIPKITIRSFFAARTGMKVAARVEAPKNGNSLYYHEVTGSHHVALRPAIYVQDYLERNPKIQIKGKMMVNYPATGEWINANDTFELAHGTQEADVLDREVKLVKVDGHLRAWEKFGLAELGPKPDIAGLGEAKVSEDISRTRRLYMLATFCLLGKFGFIRKGDKGHNIAAMLVSGEGAVLSWGVNIGEFRHAEVNTIINYFRLNPSATRLPAKSVMFSTLKPCAMCSTLIKSTWHNDGEPRIWYGMMDSGSSGGTPLLGEWSNEFKMGDFELDVIELLSEKGTLGSATMTTGTKPVRIGPKGAKEDLYEKLSTSGGKTRKMSAADWVDKGPGIVDIFEDAMDTFIHKADKKRDDGPSKRVLAHLKPFVT